MKDFLELVLFSIHFGLLLSKGPQKKIMNIDRLAQKPYNSTNN